MGRAWRRRIRDDGLQRSTLRFHVEPPLSLGHQSNSMRHLGVFGHHWLFARVRR
jgi:hypothetical protein